MNKRAARPEIVNCIRKLAAEPKKVRITFRCKYDIMAEGLTKHEICEEICSWINERKPVEEVVTKHAPGHIGKVAYVVKPSINNKGYYIKVAIEDLSASGKKLLIISAHPRH